MVRVRYSFGSRHTGRIENIRKQRVKYPDVMKNVIEISDIVLEVLDARFIEETRNLEIEELVDSLGKKLIFVFNKCDLVDRDELEAQIPSWMRPYVFVSATKGIGLSDLKGRIRMEAKRIVAARKSAGISGFRDFGVSDDLTEDAKCDGDVGQEKSWKRVHVGVIGVPNAGKSSVINFVARRAAAGTGAKAGFTKGMQKIRLSEGILILDTPGVIPESRYTTEKSGFAKDVKVGARSYDSVRDPLGAVQYLMLKKVKPRIDTNAHESNKGKNEPRTNTDEHGQDFEFEVSEDGERIASFYGVDFDGDVEGFVLALGKKKGFLIKGGVVDEDRTARLILRDWQEGKIKSSF